MAFWIFAWSFAKSIKLTVSLLEPLNWPPPAVSAGLYRADGSGPPTLLPLVVNMPVSSIWVLMLLSRRTIVSTMHFHISRSYSCAVPLPADASPALESTVNFPLRISRNDEAFWLFRKSAAAWVAADAPET